MARCVLVSFLLLKGAPAVQLTVDVTNVRALLPPDFVGFGQEMNGFLDGIAEGKYADSIFRKVASHLSPYKLRVGGITGDFVNYDGFGSSNASAKLEDWPTQERSFTPNDWSELKEFAKSTGANVVFMLNELHGRNCTAATELCRGKWDTTNLAEFLSAIKEDYGDWLTGFELGNELTNLYYQQKLTLQETIDDMLVLKSVGEHVFNEMPAYMASSTDYCRSGQPEQYLQGTAGVLSAYTYHSYPGTDGSGMPGQLLDLDWLKTNLIERDAHTNVGSCVSAAAEFPGVRSFLTESNSVYANWEDCRGRDSTANPCHMKGFQNGFWYVASLGQFAAAGVDLHARWCLSEWVGSAFPLIFRDYDGSVSVATDYWVAVLHKRLMGSKVLDANLSNQSAGLVYASCAANGGVAVMYANPANSSLTLKPPAGWWEYELYALTGESSTIRLNGNELKLSDGGELPHLCAPPRNGEVHIPAMSYGFVVFPQVQMGVCPWPGPSAHPYPGPSYCVEHEVQV